jgi:phosphoglycerate dehydrogenase-like enzyme
MVMARFRFLTPDAQYADDGVVERQTAGDGVDWDIRRSRTLAELPPESVAGCDALVVWHEMKIDSAFVLALKRCRIIVRAGVGFDHIDLGAAAEAGIPVCNTPDYGTSEVADHAIGLMLAFCRGIVSYHQNLVADPRGGFDYTRAPLVRRLRGHVFGVVGLGRIGIAAAIRAKAFGMNIVAFDPYVARGVEIAVGVDRVESLEALLTVSDVVSLHCPLTDETRNMFNASTLAKMKREAILINTARGAIVDIAAVVDALRRGGLAGAGIDVLPFEPLRADDILAIASPNRADPLIGERLILTPHAAWSSPESVSDARRLSVETAMLYLRQGRLRNLVNSPKKICDPARPNDLQGKGT